MSKYDIINPSNEVENVLYIMYRAMRLSQNEAIEYAKQYDHFDLMIVHIKEEHDRQNNFFLNGIKGYKDNIPSFIDSVILVDDQEEVKKRITGYSHIVIDQPYLFEHREFVNDLFSFHQDKTFVLVENQTIVPVKVVSKKEEYSARTIRNKIWNIVENYHKVYEDNTYFSYELKAREELEEFIKNKLDYYDLKNDPTMNFVSKMSAYLKYGFISVSYIYDRVLGLKNSDLFLEELIIRRELAYNFVYYNKNYYKFDSMTYEWAYQTMDIHLEDSREYLYGIDDYISFNTHDVYFNQAMKNMAHNGYMHGYMRMYWCKKIIEWSSSYKEAYEIALKLNNYYFIDGNTPNGYTGVAWCFGKHDRAWAERNIFGKLRYMNESGLKRKFDIKKYIKG